jgi:anti-sigma factor (TIGR02949 family)
MTSTERDTPALIDCETAARALYDYLDGRLPAATTESVRAHIETCKACAGHFAFAQRVLDLVPASLPLTGEPHGLRVKILETLKAEGFRAQG